MGRYAECQKDVSVATSACALKLEALHVSYNRLLYV